MVPAWQVLAAVAIGVGAAALSFFGGRVLVVWICWHLDRVDDEIDALLPDHPRD